MSHDEWQERVDRLGLNTIAVDRDLFLRSVRLTWPHRDPADRLIVALADRENLPIVTRDRVMAISMHARFGDGLAAEAVSCFTAFQ